MNGIYGDMGAGAWVLMSVFWVALIVLIVWLVANLLPRGRQAGDARDLAERPEEILDRRLAAGEIDVETYETLVATLDSAHAGRG